MPQRLFKYSVTSLMTRHLTVLNVLSASVAKNQHFRPCGKNNAMDRKMIATFWNCHTFSITMLSLVVIKLHVLTTGVKIWCLLRDADMHSAYLLQQHGWLAGWLGGWVGVAGCLSHASIVSKRLNLS